MTENNQTQTEEAKRLNDQLSAPVTEDNRIIPVDGTSLGPFLAQTEPYRETPKEYEQKKPTIIREQRQINTVEDLAQYRDLAHQNGDNIIMPNYQLSPEFAEKIKDIHNNEGVEYLKGNTAAQLSVYFHELAHYNRENKGLDNQPNGNGETNLTLNYVDEKSAYITQNLALVNIYNQCKKDNIEYFVYNDTKIKVDELLDMCPNLKQCVAENGSDLSSKKSIIAIAKTAAEDWEKSHLPGYEQSEFISYSNENNRSVVEQIQAVKDGQKAMDAQLKDINIGYGMHVDLPDECKSFIYPDKKYIQDFLCQNSDDRHPSNEGLLAIDSYLEKRGLKTNESKDEYIRNQYEKIVNRAPDADTTLKDLMLNAELNPDNDKRIYYTDALLQKKQNGVDVVSNDHGKTYYQVTNSDELLAQQLKEQQGKYPPDASTPEDEATRSLNNAKMTVAVNKVANQLNQQKTVEAPPPVKQTTLSNEDIMALKAKQNTQ